MIRFAELPPVFSAASQTRALHRLAPCRHGEAVLRSSSYLSLRRLSCEYHEGVLTIRGRVATFYLKQVAQSLLGRLEGVEEINNLVEVRQVEIHARPRH